jgi:hypothetical protein
MKQAATKAIEQGAMEHRPPLDKTVQHILEECRVVLPGLQALFGFQLIAVFNAPFFEILTHGEQVLHLMALALEAIAVALLMAPAAYHRQAQPQGVSESFIAYASILLTIGMLPLMIAIGVDVYVIGRVILGSAALSALSTSVVMLVFMALWFVIPQMSNNHARGKHVAHR